MGLFFAPHVATVTTLYDGAACKQPEHSAIVIKAWLQEILCSLLVSSCCVALRVQLNERAKEQARAKGTCAGYCSFFISCFHTKTTALAGRVLSLPPSPPSLSWPRGE